jgi:hypothetical protein
LPTICIEHQYIRLHRTRAKEMPGSSELQSLKGSLGPFYNLKPIPPPAAWRLLPCDGGCYLVMAVTTVLVIKANGKHQETI